MRARAVRTRPILRLLLSLAAIVALVVVAGVTVALVLAPTALLAVVLLFGRYPGEQVIHRIRRRVAGVRIKVSALLPRAPRSLGAILSALAVPGCERGPPAALGLI